MHNADGTLAGYIEVVRDITDMRTTQQQLENTAAELEALNEELIATNDELSATNQQLMAYEEELLQQHQELGEAQKASARAERLFANIIDFLPDATFVIDKTKTVIAWNRALEEMTGVPKEDVLGTSNYSTALYGAPRNVLVDYVSMEDEVVKEAYPSEFRYSKQDILHNEGHMFGIYGGKAAYLSVLAGPLYDENGNPIGAVESMRDITDQVKHREEALNNEVLLRQITNAMSDMIIVTNQEGIITYASPSTYKKLCYSADVFLGTHLTSFVWTEDQGLITEALRIFSERQAVERVTFRAHCAHGKTLWLEANGNAIVNTVGVYCGGVLGCRDVSERIELERRAAHMAVHDQLTEVHNRDHFEDRLELLDSTHPAAGIITCDIDGLKIVYDTFGHDAGDRLLIATAQILRLCVGSRGPLSRTGGDEFAIVLETSSREIMEKTCACIAEGIREYNEQNPALPLSVSVGYAIRMSLQDPLREVFRRADNSMYREKLHSRQSNRSALVSVLMKALEARDFITEGHADRLQDLVSGVARSLRLTEQQVTDLKLLAQFHDIGKVGIPDRILFKPGKLSPVEYEEMKTHCSIGHRIAFSAPDLLPIADWVLKHHEWWNGRGYPLGLKGESIPLECRILSIADAFDAMTSDRPYRKAMPLESAIEELERGKNTQFDPDLVEVFIRVIEGEGKPLH